MKLTTFSLLLIQQTFWFFQCALGFQKQTCLKEKQQKPLMNAQQDEWKLINSVIYSHGKGVEANTI